ncbi:hypothetical protein JCM17846_28160 [Iodidimonas nitroreducens]|uniref:Uncharacterized protein n=1 Tax=Iodidimonas nitroreducens TaxID=1236968 RepID=A0A5A7NBP9_9PROT|nr:hypothetical protein JCM17846_28160 [Iodidimonas nitroreducens]
MISFFDGKNEDREKYQWDAWAKRDDKDNTAGVCCDCEKGHTHISLGSFAD